MRDDIRSVLNRLSGRLEDAQREAELRGRKFAARLEGEDSENGEGHDVGDLGEVAGAQLLERLRSARERVGDQ